MLRRSLFKRLVLAYAGTFAALCLLIFVSAGTTRYWQGWTYILVFLSFGFAISLIVLRDDPELLASRLTVTPLAEPSLDQKIIQMISAVLFVALMVICGMDYRLNGARFSGWVSVLAEVSILLGGVYLYLILKENSYAASTIRVRSGQTVVSTGPYASVRHPMYAWCILFFAVTPPALGSLWGWGPCVAMWALLVVRLLREERHLMANLPGYGAYRGKVRYRLFPGVW